MRSAAAATARSVREGHCAASEPAMRPLPAAAAALALTVASTAAAAPALTSLTAAAAPEARALARRSSAPAGRDAGAGGIGCCCMTSSMTASQAAMQGPKSMRPEDATVEAAAAAVEPSVVPATEAPPACVNMPLAASHREGWGWGA